MAAYTPTSVQVVAGSVCFLIGALVCGYGIQSLRRPMVARACAWLLVLAGLIGLERLCDAEPAGYRMMVLITYGLFAMKAVVTVEARKEGLAKMAPGRWLCFAAGWFGMRPKIFSGQRHDRGAGSGRLFRSGVLRLCIGAILCWLSDLSWRYLQSRTMATVLLLPGLSLMLHFGILNMVAAGWRTVGFDCRPLFRAPLRAENLSEFWGRRWNVAFNEMTVIGVYRPLSPVTGRNVALVVSFLFSGLLHEMAISLPVMAGFGLPFLYFLLHGFALLIERGLARRGTPMAGWKGRVWTMLWLLLPLPILFHRPFLQGVLWPLIGMR